jgi:hypothetical protein
MEASETSAGTSSVPQAAVTQKPERVLSLDVLRGFDMFWITGGEGIIHTLAAATGWPLFIALSTQLEHVKWEGFHFEDLIFPLSPFIMGAVIPYALISKVEKSMPRTALHKMIFTRFGQSPCDVRPPAIRRRLKVLGLATVLCGDFRFLFIHKRPPSYNGGSSVPL